MNNNGLASVGFVQIVFGLLCIFLQVPLFVLYDTWQLIRGHTIFTLAIASFGSIAGICVFLPDRYQRFIKKTNLYLAVSSCVVAACLLYLFISFSSFFTELRHLYKTTASDEPVLQSDELYFWLLALLFFCILVVLLFSIAGIVISLPSSCFGFSGIKRDEEMKIFMDSSSS